MGKLLIKFKLIFIIFSLFSFSFLFALEDNSPARFEMMKELRDGFTPLEDLSTRLISVGKGIVQEKVLFTFERDGDKTYYSFINPLYNKNDYPYSTGSYIIRKDKEGNIDQIKIYLINRSDSYIMLSSKKGQTSANISLFGKVIYKDIYLLKDISFFALLPLESLKDKLENFVDITILFPVYQSISERGIFMVDEISQNLNDISEVFDGAMDNNGKMAYINSGLLQEGPYGFNCSGFAKWIADGIYEPKTGSLISFDRLKKRHLSVRGSEATLAYEKTRDPYFGLDWIRNIVSVLSVFSESEPFSDEDSTHSDIRSLPFISFVEERGFPIEDLDLALYILAVKNPEYFYMGSVSTPLGQNPILIQHRHVTVLFPYIDEVGSFQVVVADINELTDIDSLKRRYGNSRYSHNGYIYLVQIPTTTNFKLRPIPSVIE